MACICLSNEPEASQETEDWAWGCAGEDGVVDGSRTGTLPISCRRVWALLPGPPANPEDTCLRVTLWSQARTSTHSSWCYFMA